MEQLVADHPYFSAARLLLARKVYQQTGNLQHPAVRKALLYADQHHYAYQLITEEQVLQVVENRVAAIIPEDTLPAAANGLPENDTYHVPEAIAPETENIALEVENIATETATINLETIIAAPETEVSSDLQAEAAVAAPETEVHSNLQQEATTAASETEVEVPTANSSNLQPEIAETLEAPAAIADFEPERTLPEHTHPDSTTVILPPPVVNQSAAAEEEEEEESPAGPIKIFPMATATEETELIFQPLYTDDYFAYKRLKNPEEADALNEQGAAEMKSFTSWLRQMKDNFAGKSSKDWYHQQLHRIYEEDEEPEVSETVEKMAMDSIVFNNDIVSETLAEIWVRQQQYGNAIKIYQKLSLLNPDKNAYFAQKIVELKSKTDKNKQ